MPSADNGLLPAYSPNHVLIQFLPGEPASHLKIQFLQLGVVASETITPADADAEVTRLTLGEGTSVQQAIDALSHLPGVGLVEPDYIVTTDSVSNDTSVLGGQTWGLYGDVGAPINPYGSQAEEAWAAGYTSSTKVAVGVVDSGIDYTHPDLYLNVWLNQKEIPAALKSGLRDTDGDGLITFRDLNNAVNASYVADKNANGRIDAGDLLKDTRWADGVDQDANGYKDDLIGWDFVNNDNDPMDDEGHGTHVAGTIGAVGGNGAGVAGIGWNTQLVALKFLDASGNGLTSNSIKALDYFTSASKAGTGVDFAATNNSWGGAGYSGSLLSAITRGAQAQILYVAAAGNGGADALGDNNDTTAYYPSGYSTVATAGYEAVVSVAAITNTGALAPFSNYGSTSVDLGAPGVSIYSTMRGGGYGYM
ncbi:MAG TPA: S8 family serine peptidase, partial [Phenylobacterium sp.]